jgi:diguanylate cyclase (GGDEF)-like protein
MLFLSASLMAHVATHPEIGEKEFSLIASEILSKGRNIRNIALAKNNVITHIFPLANNESALGLNYHNSPSQWPAVKRAFDLKGTVVAGPVDLVQGGRAFIIRTPIYTKTSVSGNWDKHKPKYWGIASIVIEAEGFFQSANFQTVQNEIEFSIRGKDGLGENGDMITGKTKLFYPDSDAIIAPIMLPNGAWLVAAAPIAGWNSNASFIWRLRIFGWLTALLFASLLTALSLSRKLNKDLAFHDHLTNLPNSRLLEDRMSQVIAYSKRYSASFGLFYLDLNNFKYVNDKYGHKVGDGLLIESSKRMLASVRATDTVARVGGDEFVILVNDINEKSEMLNIRSQLELNLFGAANINGISVDISASIGFAVYPEDGASLDALLKLADERMYKEKKKLSTKK